MLINIIECGPVLIEQSLKYNIDEYIEEFKGLPRTEIVNPCNRVQKQLVRFGDELPIQANVPISMLIPVAVKSLRPDEFAILDDDATAFNYSSLYRERFSERLRKYIISKNLDDVSVYKSANLSKQQWITITENRDYDPDKYCTLAIALALQLNIDETVELLNLAGHELSRERDNDLIIEYCIENGLYDVFEVNEILFEYKQPLLG